VSRASWLGGLGVTFVARATGDPRGVAAAMRQVLGDVDADLPPMTIARLDDLVASTIAEPLFQVRLLGVFAILAAVLAGVGIYGVLAYSVALRTREIGIRLALGARAGSVLAMVVKWSLALAVTGMILGLAGAFALTRVLGALLFNVAPTDPLTFGSVAIIVSVIAVGAGLIPAIRASRVDPVGALRAD
jgi:ABC-type antimicrobial peptide transport system permease subunit